MNHRHYLRFLLGLLIALAIGLAVACLARSAEAQPGGCPGGICPNPNPPPLSILEGSQGWRRPLPPAAQRKPQQRAQHPAVVKIVSTRDDRAMQGTGTVIDRRDDKLLVLTVAHILHGGFQPSVMFADGHRSQAKILATEALWDCALLSTPARVKGSIIRLAEKPPATGEGVGWYGLGQNAVNSGQEKVLGYNASWLVCTHRPGSLRMGDSGGPIFTRNGLVGVISETEEGRPNVLRGVNCDWIRAFIRRRAPQWSGHPYPVTAEGTPKEPPPVVVDDRTPPAADPATPNPSIPAAGHPVTPSPPHAVTPSPPPGLLEESTPPAVRAHIDEDGVVERIYARIEADVEKFHGPAGPPGAAGPAGVAGAPGARGQQGLPAIAAELAGLDIDIEDIEKQGLLGKTLSGALTALGWSGPPSLAAIAGLWVFRWWLKRRRSPRVTASPPHPVTPSPPPAPTEGPAVDFPRNPPRDTTEAEEFLRLSTLEGRDPIHDALVGRFALDELDTQIEQDGDSGAWAVQLKRTLEDRFNGMVPFDRSPTTQA